MKDITIQEILAKITTLIDTQYIYASDTGEGEEVKKLILVLFPEEALPRQKDHSSIIAQILGDQEDFLLRLYTLQYTEKQIREGNLFFLRICQDANLVYKNEKRYLKPPSEGIDIGKALAVVGRRFEMEYTKIKAFREGVDFYCDKEDYSQAAFMLHQSVELSFRLVEILMTGKEKICHSIAEHQKYLRDFVPLLGVLFNTEMEKEYRLLQLLDRAYKEVRYGYNYQINKEDLQLALEKYEILQTVVRELFNTGIKTYKDNEVSSQSKEREPPLSQTVSLSAEEKDAVKKRIELLIEKKFYKYRQSSKRVYYKAELLLDSPLDVLFGVSSLVKVCVMALEYPEYDLSGTIRQPYMDIKAALEFAVQLMPYDEMECLNEIMEEYLKTGVPVV
ncbi:HEPN domain-containing protein [Sinomicrobium sp. M5D2P9]